MFLIRNKFYWCLLSVSMLMRCDWSSCFKWRHLIGRPPYEAGLWLVVDIIEMTCSFVMAVGGIKSARHFHAVLLHSILLAPYLFFTMTPKGRLMNRFADDTACIDLVMPFTMRSMMNTILTTAASLLVISLVTPIFLTCIPPIVLIYFLIQV